MSLSLLIQIIIYFVCSLLIVIPFMLGGFLLLAPKRKLLAYYQDFLLRRTKKSLKDEDFKGAYKKLPLAKVVGAFMILFSAIFSLYVFV